METSGNSGNYVVQTHFKQYLDKLDDLFDIDLELLCKLHIQGSVDELFDIVLELLLHWYMQDSAYKHVKVIDHRKNCDVDVKSLEGSIAAALIFYLNKTYQHSSYSDLPASLQAQRTAKAAHMAGTLQLLTTVKEKAAHNGHVENKGI